MHFTEKESILLTIVESVQCLHGLALLIQVVYTWLMMRKLNVLIRFMKKLLILIFVKSLVDIAETAYFMLKSDRVDDNSQDFIFTACSEFVNWICTQLVLWLVSMRFYESSIPVLRLKLQMEAETASRECQSETDISETPGMDDTVVP